MRIYRFFLAGRAGDPARPFTEAGVRLGLIGCAVVSATLLRAFSSQQPVFKSGVNYVRADVVVTDGDDKPITDLTVGDFEIREKGRLQRITDFEHISVPLAERSIDLRAEPAPPPDVGSNAAPSRDSRAIVILISQVRPADLVPLKRLLTEFVRGLTAHDSVAITYTSRSDINQDFTNDVGRLAWAIDNATASMGGHTGSLEIAFKSVITALAAAPHARKAIFYVSNGTGLPIRPDAPRDSRGQPLSTSTKTALRAGDAFDRMLDVFDKARQANVPIYTIDPHGPASPESVENLGNIASAGAREGYVKMIQARHDMLHIVAANTGGRAFVNQSNLLGAARQIVAENGSYYLLGYYPDPWAADGEFHPIDVSVKRPGLRVRARPGYLTERRVPVTLARPVRLVDSLRDGMAGGELQLRAFAAPIAPTRRGARTYLTVDVSYPAVLSERPRADDRLQLAWVALDPDARILASGEETLRVPLAQTGRDAFTLSVNSVIDAPRGRTVLRIAAASDTLGVRGTVHMPIEVPRLDDQPLVVAPLVLAATADRSVRIAHTGSSAKMLPFQPTTRRVFGAQEGVGVYVRVFPTRPLGVTAEVNLRRGDAVLRTLPLALTPVEGEKQAMQGQVGVPLAGLASGEYVIELTARLESGAIATRGVVVTVR